MASSTMPRRRSMTDAFLFSRNPEAANVVRSDLINMVEQMRQRESQVDGFASSLPKLAESDLVTLGHSDSTCPICLTSLLAILAEEETAIAMDSPAHPIEELGVTRLVQTCGHIFCRKDIRGWLYEGHTTCPTCRTPFFTAPSGDAESRQNPDIQPADEASVAVLLDSAFTAFLRTPATSLGGNPAPVGDRRNGPSSSDEEEQEEVQFEYNHDRDEFSGMYS